MRPAALPLALVNLFTVAISAASPTPGQGFYLKAVGGNTLTSSAVLGDNNTYDLGITPPPHYNNGAYGDHSSPFLIDTYNTSSLIVSATNMHPGPVAGRLALVSAGPGDRTLSKAFSANRGGPWNVGPGRDDATVKVYGWEFRDAVWGGGVNVLRWRDRTCFGR